MQSPHGITIAQKRAYLLWLRDRGFVWPNRPAAASASIANTPNTHYEVATEALSVGAVTSTLTLEQVREEALACQRCLLHPNDKITWGYGSATAQVLFIGDGTTEAAASDGAPLERDERQLLQRMTAAMHLDNKEFFVTNAILNKLPENRRLRKEELETCLHHLNDIIEAIRPEVIVTLGASATRALLGLGVNFHDVRGSWQRSIQHPNLAIMPTFHPRDLIRHPANKRLAWEDLKLVMTHLGLLPAISHQ